MLERLGAYEATWWWMGLGSAVSLVATLLAIPVLAVRLPADYFVCERRPPPPWRHAHPVFRVVLRLVKNLAGAGLVLCGVVLLFLPGQGILTILMGVVLLDFPGKFALERQLAALPSVLRALNWVRRRAGVGPMSAPGR